MIGKRIDTANKVAKRALAEREYYRLTGERMRGMLRKTRCFCSCWMCGHQRENWGITIQERKQILSEGDG